MSWQDQPTPPTLLPKGKGESAEPGESIPGSQTGGGGGTPAQPAPAPPFPRREGGLGGLGPPGSPLPWEGAARDTASAAGLGGLGPLHPASRAVAETLDPDVVELLTWLGRDLDPSAEPDDAVQTLALAQLEAQAATPMPTGPALVRAVYRHARRATWHMRSSRGRAYREPWRFERIQELAGPDGDPAITEDLGWDDVVSLLGWDDALTLWLWAVESWSLSELGAWLAVTRQQAWRRVQYAQAALRALLSPRRAG